MSLRLRNNQKVIVASPATPSIPPSYWSENTGNIIYNNNLPNGKVGINTTTSPYTFDVSTPLPDSMRIQSPTYVGVVYERNNNNVNLTNGSVTYQLDCTGRRDNSQSTLYKAGVIYNGDGTTRRGRYEEGVGDISDFFGSYQRVMTQVGTNKINIIGEDASGYIDDAVNSNTAYNMHASNIINARSAGLGLLSLDINGITNHKFFSNGNVTFGGTTNNPKAIVEISSTTKGFMLPRMTGAQANIMIPTSPSPADAGLMVYITTNTPTSPFNFTSIGWWGYDGSTWKQLG